MLNFESSSDLAVFATGAEPKDATHEANCPCNFCGKHIEMGIPYKESPKFNNRSDTKNSLFLCGSCAIVSGDLYIRDLKNAIYTKDGAMTIHKDIDIAAIMRFLPEPPLAIHYATIKQQHLIWRTPLTLDSRLIAFRMGDSVTLVNRDRLISLAKDYREMIKHINEKRAEQKLKPLPSMFEVTTADIRKQSDFRAGMISATISKLMADENDLLEADQVIALKKICSEIAHISYPELFIFLTLIKFTDDELADHRNNMTFIRQPRKQ